MVCASSTQRFFRCFFSHWHSRVLSRYSAQMKNSAQVSKSIICRYFSEPKIPPHAFYSSSYISVQLTENVMQDQLGEHCLKTYLGQFWSAQEMLEILEVCVAKIFLVKRLLIAGTLTRLFFLHGGFSSREEKGDHGIYCGYMCKDLPYTLFWEHGPFKSTYLPIN